MSNMLSKHLPAEMFRRMNWMKYLTGNPDIETLNDYEVFQFYLAKYSANYELEWACNYGEKHQNEMNQACMLTNYKGV